MSRQLNDLIFEAAQVLKKANPERYADVVRWMLAKEKNERGAEKPRRKRKTVLYSPRGEKIELYRDVIKRLEQ